MKSCSTFDWSLLISLQYATYEREASKRVKSFLEKNRNLSKLRFFFNTHMILTDVSVTSVPTDNTIYSVSFLEQNLFLSFSSALFMESRFILLKQAPFSWINKTRRRIPFKAVVLSGEPLPTLKKAKLYTYIFEKWFPHYHASIYNSLSIGKMST